MVRRLRLPFSVGPAGGGRLLQPTSVYTTHRVSLKVLGPRGWVVSRLQGR